ncbi:hypothetical protein [Shimia sediminis]|uniref:hypothetical protein n=1 Tax=Shimia sediminis TaxID=2497945 RepID=UPI000F8CE7ED|nr:hypothetical protein [Shimia sediminis]
MKPNFALSLSFEGISLLCRVKDGWHRLGDASLASEDLGAELDALRAMAEEIDGPDFRCKLILPNDQVKYLLVDTGRGSRAKREAAAIAALEEATPYSGSELAFDLVAAGRNTHVAAVARETLAEAEAFAVENQFNPVSFVAIPPDGGYPNEPTFDLTQAATDLLNGEPLDADDTVILITGSGPLPKVAPSDPTPEPVAKDPPLDPAPDSPLEEAAANDTGRSTPPEQEAPPEVVSAFSSIRARRTEDDPSAKSAPALGAAERSVAGTNAPSVPPVGDKSPHSEAPLRFDPKSVIAGLKASPPDFQPLDEEQEAPPAASSFFSRRNVEAPPAGAVPTEETIDAVPLEPQTTAAKRPAASERHNMTLFGEREGKVGGKPRHLGLILTVVLLVFLAGVAIWASLFLEDGVAGLFRRDPVPQIAEMEAESKPVEVVPDPADMVETDALAPISADSITDTAEIEAMEGEGTDLVESGLVEADTDVIHPTAPTTHEAEARYAVTGIWERAPEQPATPGVGSTDTFYLTSIDRNLPGRDAVALPSTEAMAQDWPIGAQGTPLPFDTKFDLNAQGLVRATPQGALNPGGVMVYLGRPSTLPQSFPERTPATGEGVSAEQVVRLSKIRPKARPDDLIEQIERASYGGRTLTELAKVRPRLRPESAKAEEEQDTTPTEAAVTASVRPRVRPSNMAQLVARATPSDPVVATPVAATVTPSIPSSASVARQATIQNAINLNKINLIGVYGTTTSRRALVRLANGRYRKVQVGDRIDGGNVAAISDTELRYVKSGKNVILKLPKG